MRVLRITKTELILLTAYAMQYINNDDLQENRPPGNGGGVGVT